MVQQDGGRTPGAALPMPRRPAHSEGGATSRRATRNAAAQPVDNSLLHIDPEAAARHIRALKKQQEAALAGSQQRQQRQQPAETDEGEQEQLQEQQAHEQAFQEEQAEEEAERSPDAAQAAATAATADAAAAVLVESTKENLPEPAPGAAAVAAATPLTDGIPALGAASKHSGKGTLTAVVQQHGGSRLRCEAGATPPGAQAHAAHAAGTDQQAVAGLAPADTDAAAGGNARDQHQNEHAEAAGAPAGEEEPLQEYAPTAEDHARVDQLQAALAQQTEGLVLDSLESIHAKLARCVVKVPSMAALLQLQRAMRSSAVCTRASLHPQTPPSPCLTRPPNSTIALAAGWLWTSGEHRTGGRWWRWRWRRCATGLLLGSTPEGRAPCVAKL